MKVTLALAALVLAAAVALSLGVGWDERDHVVSLVLYKIERLR